MPKKLSREQRLRKERRLVRVPVDIELLAKSLLQPPSDNYYLAFSSPIPSNAVFITAYYSMEALNAFFVFAHELFDEAPEGEAIPIKDAFTEVELKDVEDDY